MYYVNPFIEKLVRIYPEGNRSGYLRLDMNENPEGLPEIFIEKCKKYITADFVSSYPNRESLVRTLSKYHNLSENMFCITDGSEMAIKYIYEVFGEKGKKVVTVNPTFEMYDVYCNMFGLKHITYDISENFEINNDDLIKLIDEDTSLVCLLNPNNPVGGSYSNEDIVKIIEKARTCNAIVVIDEAYHYFCNSTSIDIINSYDNVIILRTFSKLFSLASCRIGYAIACSKIADLLNKVRPTFDTNSFALLFAEMALKDNNLKDELIKIEKEGRLYLIEKLKEYNYKYYYGEGNYIFIKPHCNTNDLVNKFYENKILVKTYSKGILKDYIRINTGSILAMKKFFNAFILLDDGKNI